MRRRWRYERHTSELDFLNTALHDTRDADTLVLCPLFELGTEEDWIKISIVLK